MLYGTHNWSQSRLPIHPNDGARTVIQMLAAQFLAATLYQGSTSKNSKEYHNNNYWYYCSIKDKGREV